MTNDRVSHVEPDETTGLGRALVTIALFAAVIGSVGAPLITPVALGMHVSLGAAQWTLTVTLFTGAIAGPILGRLGSGPHRRDTIVLTLALVTLGGALTAAPLPFVCLLIGRGLQGLGLGVSALLMSVARDQLPAERSTSTIATLSVASTIGIGVGYPLVGFLDQIAGLRVAYGLGFLLSLAALVLAWRVVPADVPQAQPRVDTVGALLLGAGTLGVLLVIAEPAVWEHPWAGWAVLASAIVVLSIWVVVELRTRTPLVDLRLLARPALVRANSAILMAGVGMYLLFSLLTRFVQTPAAAGYGFALSGVLAGAALIPFSVFGFVAGKLSPHAVKRFSDRSVYAASVASVMVAAAIFAVGAHSLVVTLIAMAVLGTGVGGVFAVMPKLVLASVPQAETASVLAVNQVVRSIGFSIGSALAGLLLAAATSPGSLLPGEHGYTRSALWVLPMLTISAAAILLARRRGR